MEQSTFLRHLEVAAVKAVQWARGFVVQPLEGEVRYVVELNLPSYEDAPIGRIELVTSFVGSFADEETGETS